MLKTIPIRDLRIGMFIHKMGGSWMNHPFLRSSFELTSEKDFQALKQSAVPEVVIDTDKGLDVEPPPAAEPPQPAPVAPVAVTTPAADTTVPYEREIERAKAIHTKAVGVVKSIFKEVRMGSAIEMENVIPLVDEINQSLERNAGALLSIVRLKTVDDYTYMHSVAVCGLMVALGRRLGLEGEVLRVAGFGGLLHDVGKMMMPTEVLNKPGKLTDDEWKIMKRHPREGWEILKKSNVVSEVPLDICLHHHERVDGKGYPDQMSGDALTLFARMGAVCDVYDAVTSDRPYKKAWAAGEAIKRMVDFRHGFFDETVFQAFVKTLGIYPTGSLVRLKSGRLAVVTEQSESSLLKPKVKVFFSTKSKEPINMDVVDLSRSPDAITGLESEAVWGFDMSKIRGF